MKSTIFLKSSNGHIYMYDFIKKELVPCHSLMQICYMLEQKNRLDELHNASTEIYYTIREKYNEEDIEYYKKKYMYYKERGFFSSFEKKEFLKYDRYVIEESLCNTNSIVFEVTDACNLNCAYCTYGSMYYDYDARNNQMMSFDTVKTVLNYFMSIWTSHTNKSASKIIAIGFYGGEPLLNIDLIKKSVDYCNSLNLTNRKFKFTMTTNAVLIDRYIHFLVENDFQITISLDGSKYNHSYRVFHNGENSFDKVFKNIKIVQDKYPEFFEANVSFNSVLHNRNSVEAIHNFIFQEFGKTPQINSINNYGIKSEKLENFKSMFVLYNDSADSNNPALISERFTEDPNVFRLGQFLLWYGNNQFFDYESFLYSGSKQIPKALTGTCLPFSRKMFVTVNKKILTCERVDFKYSWGYIDGDKVILDLDSIAEKYNSYYDKMYEICKNCYMINGCRQCIFQLNNLDSHPICKGHKTESAMIDYIKKYVDMLENNIIPFEKLFNEINFS